MIRLWMTVGCAAAALTIAAGCGGGGDDNAPTKAAFVKQADGICKKGNQQFNTKAHAYFKQQGLSENERPSQTQTTYLATKIVLPAVQSEVSQIDDLTPPKGDEDQVQAITDEANSAIAKGKQDPTALISNKSDPFAKANKLAKDYGLKVCGS